MIKTAAIIPSAGSGLRVGSKVNKALLNIGAMPILVKTLMPFIISEAINIIIIPARTEDLETINSITNNLNTAKPIKVIQGGATRTESVRLALKYAEGYDITLIHDAARPFVSTELIERVIDKAYSCGGSICGIPLTDTIKKMDGDSIVDTPNRNDYILAQTPQAFRTNELINAYDKATEDVFTDDASVYERYIGKVFVVPGSPSNIKITTIEDYNRFFPNNYRIGAGYDVHRLVENRPLILGGVNIPHYKGLLGHSDADCLIHAIMDAILTASGNRDIGVLFPDNDEKYLNISSLILLNKVYNIVKEQGYIINNISAEIIAEKPKMSQYVIKMQETIADALDMNAQDITLALTTSEGLGITGEEKAIAVYAAASLYKVKK